jgi:UPF0755 protein
MKSRFQKTTLKISVPLIACLIMFGLFYPSCGDKKEIIIRRGEGPSSVSATLKENNIIGSRKLFKALLKLTGKDGDIKAGTYLIPEKINYLSLISRLQKGSGHYIKVTLPEGFSTGQVAARLFSKGVIDSKEEFIQKVIREDLRGFLYPETYYFPPGAGVDKAVKTMTDQFFKVYIADLINGVEKSGFSLKEIVTLASLIEKEAKIPGDRPVISDIFRKRIKIRMYLESCASILFALGEHRETLTYKDLEVDSPYNTYRHFGLPPTPICNPGYESLYAAVYPADTEYMYFFTRGTDGAHIFAKTYKEHLRLQKEFK